VWLVWRFVNENIDKILVFTLEFFDAILI
jgi:hypothetical protein